VVGELLNVLRTLNASGITIVLVEQSMNIAVTVAPRAVFLEKGEVRFTGDTAQLADSANLVRSVFLRDVKARDRPALKTPRPGTATDEIPIALEVRGISKSYGGVTAVKDVDLRVPTGQIVGVIGANGAGKTTLFRMIVGQESPDRGSIAIGETVQLAYVDQSRDDLRADASVFDEIAGGAEFIKVGSRELPARAYVSSFNFRGTDQQKRVGSLSGGERNRVHLAKLLKSGGNVLLLDEPTNDLDVDTLRALEAGLESFPGCAVVISHDRWFLDRIATHVLAFEGDSQVRWFEGNFTEYEAFRHRELGTAADQPHRIRYKRLAG